MADEFAPGLYEELVSAALIARLASVDDELVERIALRPADAADRIAQHLAREVGRAIDAVPEAERVATGIELARRLIGEMAQRLPRSGTATSMPDHPASVLAAVGERRPDGRVQMPGRPLIPLLDTTPIRCERSERGPECQRPLQPDKSPQLPPCVSRS